MLPGLSAWTGADEWGTGQDVLGPLMGCLTPALQHGNLPSTDSGG